MSILEDCSNCVPPSGEPNHIFLPVYLDSNGEQTDDLTRAVEEFDASFNLILDASHCSACTLRDLVKYKVDASGNHTFMFNSTKKTEFETQMKNDLANSIMTLHGGTFISENSTTDSNFGTMFLQYMADAFFGHPMGQAAITNDDSIVSSVANSDIYLQFSYALTNGMTTNSFTSHNVCRKVLAQLKDKVSDRFIGEQTDVSYNMPWCPGDDISIYVRMNSNISLNSITSTNSSTNMFSILKSMFENNEHIDVNETAQTVKLKVKTWRIKIILA